MSIDYCRIATPGIQGLRPYQPGKPMSELHRELGIDDIIKLASNENPLGPSPRAVEAMQAALPQLHRYPDAGGYALKARLADLHGVARDMITLGNGSNDVLDLIARCFLAEGRGAIYSRHAFAVYPLVTQACGAVHQMTEPLPADHPHMPYGHDLAAMRARIDARTRVIFIANPNNPTGTWLRSAELEAFLAEVPADVMVVVDEAYTEYVQEDDYPDALQWLDRFPNLIVTRTFSKIYGIAGARAGYAVSGAAVADLLNRVRQPFNMNLLAQEGALAALEDRDYVTRSVAVNQAGLAQIRAGLDRLGLRSIPTVANFVTFEVGEKAMAAYQGLLHEGVIVRPVAGDGLPRHLRVSIGLEEENRRFLQALPRVMESL